MRTTRTKDDGTWAALFVVGEGGYEIRLRAIGYEPRALRLVRQGEGSTILSADVRMVVAAYLLLPLAFGVVYGQVPGWAGR